MARSKYDTNPLDPKVGEAASEAMNEQETRLISDRPVSSQTPLMAGGVSEAPSIPRWGEPSAPASQGPSAAPPPAQAPHAFHQAAGAWPPVYSPPLPAPQAKGRKGLDIDANVEAGLSYLPVFGAVMAFLVLVKEPRENYFARFNAMQALILQGTLLAARLLLSMLTQAGAAARAPELLALFASLISMVDLVALVGLGYAGISSFRMRMISVPVAGPLAEKYMGSIGATEETHQ